jgi:hypothetical protein
MRPARATRRLLGDDWLARVNEGSCRGNYAHATTWGRYIARTGTEQLCKRYF